MNGKGDKRRRGSGYSAGWDRIYKREKKMKNLWEYFKILAILCFAFFVLKLMGVA